MYLSFENDFVWVNFVIVLLIPQRACTKCCGVSVISCAWELSYVIEALKGKAAAGRSSNGPDA